MAFERVKRTRKGFVLRLPVAERELLRRLPGQLRELLTEGDPDDPVLKRLFPSAYLDDPAAAAEFDGFVRDDLTSQRLRAIETMERTIDAERLSEEELLAWLAAINDVRLVLGVRLAVTEESRPEDFAEEQEQPYAVYAFLSYLEDQVVGALAR